MTVSFELSEWIPATPLRVYETWLSSQGHTAMTGGSPATASPEVGAAWTAWNGYAWGVNVELEPARRIVQSWRTHDFDEAAPDSTVDLLLDDEAGGTRLTLHHMELPADGEQYRQGWIDWYFSPMKEYFGG